MPNTGESVPYRKYFANSYLLPIARQYLFVGFSDLFVIKKPGSIYGSVLI